VTFEKSDVVLTMLKGAAIYYTVYYIKIINSYYVNRLKHTHRAVIDLFIKTFTLSIYFSSPIETKDYFAIQRYTKITIPAA
jgi:hypothetical protein